MVLDLMQKYGKFRNARYYRRLCKKTQFSRNSDKLICCGTRVESVVYGCAAPFLLSAGKDASSEGLRISRTWNRSADVNKNVFILLF
jgi:hypothetical protein